MFFADVVNKDVVDKLARLSFNQFLNELFENEDLTWADKDECLYYIDIQYKLIKKLCLEYQKHPYKDKYYKLKREYSTSKNSPDGRVFVKDYGLQRINNKIRGLLCNDIYYDFDMINAHPSILLNYCREKQISYYKLAEYVDNRDLKINELMTETGLNKDQVKCLFLKSMNSEFSIKTYKKNNKSYNIKNPFFIELDKEFKNIQIQILKLNNDLKKDILKKSNDNNIGGRVLNRLLCSIENKILFEAVKKLKLENNDIVPMFDGFMVLKDNLLYSIDETIKKLNENNNSIKWSLKEHNLELYDKLNCLDISDNDNTFSGIYDDLIQCADHLLSSIFENKIFYCMNQLYFIDDFIFITNERIIKNRLLEIITNNDIWISKKENLHKLNSSIKDVEDLRKVIISKAPTNNNYLNQIWLNTKNKLFFKNGYYDFKNDTFNKLDIKNPTPFIIERNFINESNPEIREQIFKKVLYPLFIVEDIEKDKDQYQLMEYILMRLGRIMGGYIEDKKWLLFQGFRDSGKSLLADFIKNAVGLYADFSNASNFIGKRLEDNKSLGWMLDYQFKRFCFNSEVSLDYEIDGNKIKKFVSGGDTLNARKNYQDEISFKIQSSLIMMCNDIPEIKPKDCLEKCDKIYMKCKFIDNNFTETKLNNYKYYKKDDSIKTDFINRDEVLNEFILLLIEYSKKYNLVYPKNILKYENSLDDNDEDDITNITKHFKILEGNKLTNKEIKEFKQDNNISFTINKISKILLGYFQGSEKYRNGNSRGIKHIALKDEDDDEEDEDN